MTANRYVAVVGVADDETRRAHLIDRAGRLADLSMIHIGNDIALFGRQVAALSTEEAGPQAFLIGETFNSSGQPAVPKLAAIIADRSDPFQHILHRHWGEWLCLFRESDDSGWQIGRDPSGGIGCYYASEAGCVIACSHVRDLLSICGAQARIHWPSISGLLLKPAHRTGSTGLEGVRELLPGFALTIGTPGMGQRERAIWSPWDHVQPRPKEDFEDMLQRAIDKVVGAFARCFSSRILALSGGLDSSVLAASLARSNLPFGAFSYIDMSAEGNELSYAQMVCDAFGVPLHSIRYRDGEVDLLRTDAMHSPRPTVRIHAQAVDRARDALAREMEMPAVFAGDGGDNLFCFLQSAAPVVDRLMADDSRGSAWKTAHDISDLAGVSLPRVAMAVAKKLARGNAYRWPRNDLFLAIGAKEEAAKQPMHPWLASPKHALPGKVAHIALLVRTQGYREAYHSPNARIILPYLAQPLLELCLSHPSWRWCEGGRNRMPVRRAFEKRLPTAILERRTKGGPDSYCIGLVEQHRDLLCQRIMDGHLAREGIVDRKRVEISMAEAKIADRDCHRLLAFADVEAWADAWSSGR